MERKDVTHEDVRQSAPDEPQTTVREPGSRRTPTPARGRRAALDRSLAHGIAWIGGVKWLTQALTWGSTIFVARVLDPSDFGLYAFATSYMGIVTLLTEFGIGTTIVTFRDMPDDHVAQVNALALLFGVAGFLVSCLAAPLLSAFYRAPELTLVVIATSSVFVITGVRVVPQAILQRDLRFRDLAINDGVRAIVTSTGAVIFALAGFRYWTLVASEVLAALVATILIVRLVRVSFRWPQWRELRDAVTFSQQTIASRVAWYLYQNADFYVAGRMLGQQALGAYNFGWTLASTPIERVTSLAARVTPSILSAVQHDLHEVRRYLVTVTEALAMVAFPLTVGLALVADLLVPLVLGDKWSTAVAPLQILAVAASIRSITPLFPQVLMVTGANHRAMWVNVFGLVVMPVAFIVGARWNTPGIAMAWLLAYPTLVVIPMAIVTFRQVQLDWRAYVRALVPAGSATLVMSITVLAARAALPDTTSRAVSLLVTVASGAAGYGATLWLLHRERVLTYVRVARRSTA
ncbi:MAG: Teichuronic acid biosynthesis protein TuaB [Gemmatimonadaceae bacterium]|nr:Teichuronic acid biosynthesis protein TuaB [Gemmatimonadaceae bacterium]